MKSGYLRSRINYKWQRIFLIKIAVKRKPNKLRVRLQINKILKGSDKMDQLVNGIAEIIIWLKTPEEGCYALALLFVGG